jgi:hypothetical protein
MELFQENFILIELVLSLTLIGAIALSRNTDLELILKLGRDISIHITSKRSPKSSSLSRWVELNIR